MKMASGSGGGRAGGGCGVDCEASVGGAAAGAAAVLDAGRWDEAAACAAASRCGVGWADRSPERRTAATAHRITSSMSYASACGWTRSDQAHLPRWLKVGYENETHLLPHGCMMSGTGCQAPDGDKFCAVQKQASTR